MHKSTLNTVLGSIDSNSLGITATHEHILLDLSGFYQALPVAGIADPSTEPVKMENLGILSRDPYALRDNLYLLDYETQKRELLYFQRAGGNTVVDASLPGIGRNPQLLRRIASETGLNVLMGTGYYVGETHPARLGTMSESEIAAELIRDLTEGVEGTDIKAGYIGEIGISEHFDDRERKVLRAAALAHLETDAAINIHINPWTTNGIEAADILLSYGVRASSVCISHVDVENRVDYIHRLLAKGVFVEFDNFGKEYYVRREVRNPGYGLFVHDLDRVKLIRRLIDEGYLGQLLLSCDICLKNLLHTYGGWGYDHLLTNIVPMLEDEQISSAQIQEMLRVNPVIFLAGGE